MIGLEKIYKHGCLKENSVPKINVSAVTVHDATISTIIPLPVRERKSTCQRQAMPSYRLTSDEHYEFFANKNLPKKSAIRSNVQKMQKVVKEKQRELKTLA